MLKWNEADFIEYLGVRTGVLEKDSFLIYAVSNDGLKLCISLMPDRNSVYFTLFRDGVDQPIMGSGFLDCERAEYVRPRDGETGYLEFVVRESNVTSLTGDPARVKYVKVTINPHIQIQLDSRPRG